MAQTWDADFKNKPDGDDAPSSLDDQQRAHRAAVEERMENEHDTVSDDTAGLSTRDWRHKEGSARAYYETPAPTKQPGSEGASLDDLTGLDNGRIWVDSDTDIPYIWNGTEFVVLKTSAAISTATTFDEVVTLSKGFISSIAGIETLTTGTNWEVPTDVTVVIAIIIGAGGGAGGTSDSDNGASDGVAGGTTTFNDITSAGGIGGYGGNDDQTSADTVDGWSAGNGGFGGVNVVDGDETYYGGRGRGGKVTFHLFTGLVPAANTAYEIGTGGAGGTEGRNGGDGGNGSIILIY